MTDASPHPRDRRARIAIVAAVALGVLVAGAILLFAGPARAKGFATLRVLEGSVDVRRGDGRFERATDRESLREGDAVRTGSDGRAEIEYFDGSLTRLDVGSTFELTALASLEGDPDNREIEGTLDPGRTFNRVVEITDSQSRFDVATPTATASVRGTAHVTEQGPDGTFTLWVLDGEVVVVLPDGSEILVRAGEGLKVTPEGAAEGPFQLGPEELEDAWVLFNLCEVELTLQCPVQDEPEPVDPGTPDEPDEPNEPETSEDGEAGALGGEGGGGFSSDAGSSTPGDEEPPRTSITGGPRGPHGSTSATFRFRSDEAGSTFACRLDDGAWRSCSSPRTYAGLAPGEHVFRVRATDGSGNGDPTPARRRFTVDTAPPETTITSGPGDTPPPGEVTFTFVSSEPGSRFQCRLEEQVGTRERTAAQASGVFEPCSSPKTYVVEDFTGYTFSVRAIDPAGNVDPTPDTYPFYVCSECGVGREQR